MSPEKLLSRHPLKNGLILEFWDLSRPLIGDRGQVVLEIRVAVPMVDANLPPDWGGKTSQIIALLGPEVVFTQQEVRNFVAEGETSALLAELQERLFSSLEGYLGHPEFGVRFIRKKYADYQERQGYQR